MAEVTETELVRRMKCLLFVFNLTQIITVRSILGFDGSPVSVEHAEESPFWWPQLMSGGFQLLPGEGLGFFLCEVGSWS